MRKSEPESKPESEQQEKIGPSHLILGDTVYRLQPETIIPPSEAVKEAHARIIGQARLQAQKIVQTANITADGILTAALKERKEAAIDRLSLEKAKSKAPPAWMVNSQYPIKFVNGRWHIQFQILIRFTHFDIEFTKEVEKGIEIYRYSWESLLGNGEYVPIWLPIKFSGEYAHTTAYLGDVQGFNSLPHAGHMSSCWSSSAIPKEIKSLRELEQFSKAMEFAFRRVQLNSMMGTPSDWIKHFKRFVPAELYAVLVKGDAWAEAIALVPTDTPAVDSKKDEELEWEAEQPTISLADSNP